MLYEDENRIYSNNYYDIAPVKSPKRPKNNNKVWMLTIFGCIMFSAICGFGGGYLANSLLSVEPSSYENKVIYQSVVRTSSSSSSDSSLSISDVAAVASNSVVEITTETVMMGTRMGQFVSEGAGSGVIITSDGYILTNNHVIDGASKITVRLKDGTSYNGFVVGIDEKTDLAVIKVDASDLQPAVFGDSSSLTVGETAVAIGNPLGQLGGTVTSGIISALDREISIDGETMTLLQTSAAINPGNSGGGLFNSYGELIGIVNAKSSGSDIEGLGFAIPGNTAKEVAEQIITYGYVKGRPYLGITTVDISDAQSAMMYRVNQLGVYILKVNSGSNAERAGLSSGDKIVSINGTSIGNITDLNCVLSECAVGDLITVDVQRNNRTVSLKLELEEYIPSTISYSNNNVQVVYR